MSEEIYVVQEMYEKKLFVTRTYSQKGCYQMPQMHFHDGYEIWISMTDGAKFYIEDEIYSVNRGGVMLVNNKEIHKSVAPVDRDFERYIISFLPEYIAEYDYGDGALFRAFTNHPLGITHCTQLGREELKELQYMIHMLQGYLEGKGADYEQLKKHCLAQLVVFCNICYEKKDCFIQREARNVLEPATSYIKNNISSQLSLEELALKLYVSKGHLIRLFKAETGMTPIEYITMMRIQRAKFYLAEGMPVLEVCEMVGYADESHFIRTFKKITGITPGKYGMLCRTDEKN